MDLYIQTYITIREWILSQAIVWMIYEKIKYIFPLLIITPYAIAYPKRFVMLHNPTCK